MHLLTTPGRDVREAPNEQPADYRADPEPWPLGPLTDDAPLSARIALGISRNLHAALTEEGLTDRGLATRSGLSHTSIGRILRGEGLPDFRTLLLLEAALQRTLWPTELHTQIPATRGGDTQPGAYPPGHEPAQPVRPVTTAKTRAVLRLWAEGKSHARIAETLGVATRTVGKRLAAVYEALGIPPGESFALGVWWATTDERHLE
ncbi:helix-turn-helix domain-containing protein [Streptomyces sp. NPDC056716]|uniref:helix-turn-helix domain-containing protein n=1 Tax=unclassified Streptomyces TaxID=2593676 RepID=UPI0036D0DF02